MIELGKQYKTRDGREVRIYAVDGGGRFPVHGAIKLDDGKWCQEEWTQTGSYNGEKDGHAIPHDLDLIEVKPRIQREVWVNVFEHCCGIHDTQDKAGYFDKNGLSHRIACVKLVIDCEEGEGL